MAIAERQDLVVRFLGEDKLSPVIGRMEGRLNRIGSLAERGASNAARNIAKIGVVAAAGVAGALAASVKAAADYEQAFAGVRKTVDATTTDLSALSDSILKLSTTIPISATELAGLGETAGALGVTGTRNLESFIRVTAILGETTDLTAQQAADSLGVLSNVLGLTAEDYDRFASSLVNLGNVGASTESQIITIAERFGAAGKLAGLSTDQIIGFSSAVASLGIEIEAGGSALQRFALEVTKFASLGGDELEVLAKTAGVTAKQFQTAFEQDAGKALETFIIGLGKLAKGEQLAVLEALGFNDVRISRTLLGLAGNTELLTYQLGEAKKGWYELDAANAEASKKFATFSSQMQILRNSIARVGIALGNGLLPPLQRVIKAFTEQLTAPGTIARFEQLGKSIGDNLEKLVKQFGPQIPAFISGITDALSQGATFLGRIDWNAVNGAFAIMATASKALLNTFLSMPSWVQTAVITGWGLNKLTGGALGGIIGEITKGIGGAVFGKGGFFSRGSPANPMFTKEVGLGGVGKGVAPVGGAAGAGLASMAAFAAPFAAYFAAQFAANEANTALAGQGFKSQVSVAAGPFDIIGQIKGLASVMGLVEEAVNRNTDAQNGRGGDEGQGGIKPAKTGVQYPLQTPQQPSARERTRDALDRLPGYVQNLSRAIERERGKPGGGDAAKIAEYTAKLNTYQTRLDSYITRVDSKRTKVERERDRTKTDTRSEKTLTRIDVPDVVLSDRDRATITRGLKVDELPPLKVPTIPPLRIEQPPTVKVDLPGGDTRSEGAGTRQALERLSKSRLTVKDEETRRRLAKLDASTDRVRSSINTTGSRSEAALSRIDSSTQRVRDAVYNLPGQLRGLLVPPAPAPIYVTVTTKATVSSTSVSRSQTTERRVNTGNRKVVATGSPVAG
jgi:TP901 family phage tail tape measure protein